MNASHEYHSRVDTASSDYSENHADQLALVEQLQSILKRPAEIGEKARGRFQRRGQLMPLERLSRLLDPGAPFLELCNIAGYLTDSDNPDMSIPGASCIAGIGFVSGVRCGVMVDDSSINAGAMTEYSGRKFNRLMHMCQEHKMPLIHLVESAGANLLGYKVEMWNYGGSIFANLSRLSAAGCPVITVLHGLSVAGGAYQPGLSDYVIAVRGNAMAALAGPALLKAATGETADNESLGGAEMHATVSGLAEYVAEDDAHGLAICRDLVDALEWNRHAVGEPSAEYAAPLYPSEELLGVVPTDFRQPYDAREVVARIVDGSRIMDFKPDYGASLLCLQAKIFGLPVGVIANNGPIDPNGASKAAQFIQLCDQAGMPLVFLQNITGFMVGTESERAGMIKHGAKMIQAVTNTRVPRLTVMIGASFGAGNYGMCGQGYDPDFIFSWPSTQIGVMGGEQAAKTMSQVFREGAERKGVPVDEEALAQQEKTVTELYDRQSGAFYTSGRMMDDGLIDPRDTRRVLGMALQTCLEGRQREVFTNTFGVGRM